MKTKLLILILFVCCTATIFGKEIQKGDTLLVYLSDQPTMNQLYVDFIKLKFPQFNVVLINDNTEFNRYIPAAAYKNRTSEFGQHEIGLGADMSAILDAIKKDASLSLEELKNRKNLRYFFFDINCKTYTNYNQIYNANGSNSGTTSDAYRYTLEIVRYDGNDLSPDIITELDIRKDHYDLKHIPLGNIDKASDWLNPLTLTFYLHQYLNNDTLTKDDDKIDACQIDATDTIYISAILNNENVSQEVGLNLKETKFKSQVSYFEHIHIKLEHLAFAQTAYRLIKNSEHFYFYYYHPGSRYFYIVDGKDFKTIYFVTLKVGQPTAQYRSAVKNCSEFRKKCKG